MVARLQERRRERGLPPEEILMFIDTRETLGEPPLTPQQGKQRQRAE